MMLPEIVDWKSTSSNFIRETKYLEVIKDFYAKLPQAGNGSDYLDQLDVFIETYLPEEEEEGVLCLGIAALGLFIQSHWTGPPLDEETVALIEKLKNQDSHIQLCKKLIIDDSLLVAIQYPHLLVFALKVFQFSLKLKFETTVTYFWQMRAHFIHQQILDDISPILHDKILSCILEIEKNISQTPEWRLEKVRIYLYYFCLELAKKEVDMATEDMRFSYQLEGVLGKRTKFQQHNIPQLICTTKSFSPQPESTADCNTQVPFSDDVQLEHMIPADEKILALEMPLTSLQYGLILGAIKLRVKEKPHHITTNEENKAMLDRLLRVKGPWAMVLTATILRLDFAQKREKNVEKTINQIEWILQQIGESSCPLVDRMNRFFISYLPSINELKLKQAEGYIFYSDFKMAFDIYEKAQKWQLAIECLMMMNEKYRAENLIRRELSKDPVNVTLMCYLGDITGDPKYYEQVLEAWGKPSSRVHRHLGLYFYKKKKYPESIEHFSKSLELNRFQPAIWLKLGWCAMLEKDFKLGVKSYQNYCTIESDDRMAWDNYAHCLDQLGESSKAIKILEESLKVDNAFWKTYDSLTVLHTKLGEYDKALKRYQQTLKLNPDYYDYNTLKELKNAYKESENPSKRSEVIDLLQETVKRKRHVHLGISRLLMDLIKDTGEEYQSLMTIHQKACDESDWWKEKEMQSFLSDLLNRLLMLHIKKGYKKNFFLYIAQPTISMMLAYDPENEQFLAFQTKMKNVLSSLDN